MFPHERIDLKIIVEDGPFAADAASIYQELKQSQGAKYRPSMYAEMLSGFAAVPKGVLRSLEAADYLAGRAISDLERGGWSRRREQMAVLLDRELMQRWYEDMLLERQHRAEYAQSRRSPPVALS
jgi:hypothetical protein